MKNLVFTILSLAILVESFEASSTPCGDWVPYKEEYCFKVFDNVSTESYENAEKTCQDNDSSLITIRNEDEQKFLTDLLFTKSKLVDDVWLGASFDTNSNKYRWQKDRAELVFSNWAPGSPKNHADYCVMIHADEELRGKWADELCAKKNAVVCQKKQSWSLAKMQDILMNVMMNPAVPIGFIYAQLPNEKAPSEIWPQLAWKDVSNEYAGVFFRTEGGEAASFGTVQEANSNRVERVDCQPGQGYEYDQVFTITPGEWGHWMYTGNDGGRGNGYSWQLYLRPGEVRPRNMAMRIWKRTA